MPPAPSRSPQADNRLGVLEQQDRFPLHGLKHRGVTAAVGNGGDKQDAAGHQSPATTGHYHPDLPAVKPPRGR
ncbi:MAG TPA: hypothetical protein DEB32_16665 [Stenotrophomonas sp.]|uniref:Integrase n=1 Tax=Stenotrophomonas maltophilia TaxID=40324 RepID=A0A4S2CZE0_STEMA|nr:hypothetical protein E5352_11340 [Stenotrophomonas maltophilia]HBS64302.1 hypothetical protein [Stenotrophomonas sp.]